MVPSETQVDFAPSQGKCALTSTVLRTGKGTELVCGLSWGGVLLVALSVEQDQLWLSLAHPSDGDTEVEVEELMLFLEVLHKCLCHHSVLMKGAIDRILKTEQNRKQTKTTKITKNITFLVIPSIFSHGGFVACLQFSSMVLSRLYHVPTLSSCSPSKAHFINENHKPVWTW